MCVRVTHARVCAVAALHGGRRSEFRCPLDPCPRPWGHQPGCAAVVIDPSLSDNLFLLRAHHGHHISFALGSRLMEQPLWGVA